MYNFYQLNKFAIQLDESTGVAMATVHNYCCLSVIAARAKLWKTSFIANPLGSEQLVRPFSIQLAIFSWSRQALAAKNIDDDVAEVFSVCVETLNFI
jgi:hypothetical protein